ncbi:unnamed protein product [Acanthoscelides obtectus]|uniref:Tetraspanin n=1 Tax=Acanthoscelides obtectus TaxID=200917 RepID=A0A9P0LFX6_ACAOB|nr:unnamed protein product [Acanthoscelides obtectus]CAK1675943.1 hypothetical protein AOBTE_LOCUS30503 [Acanthoscelides obtectus]
MCRPCRLVSAARWIVLGISIAIIIISCLQVHYAVLRISNKTIGADDKREVEFSFVECIVLLGLAVVGILGSTVPNDWLKARMIAVYTTGMTVLVVYQLYCTYHILADIVDLEDTRTYLEEKFADRKTDVTDWVQEYWQCCGIDDAEYWTAKNKTIPKSCKNKYGKLNNVGCFDLFYASRKSILAVTLFCFCSNIALSIVGTAFGYRLLNSLREAWYGPAISDLPIMG